MSSQRLFVLSMLRCGPQTTFDLHRAGVMRPASRISELRDLGYDIETYRETLTDDFGLKHFSCARYALISEKHIKESPCSTLKLETSQY